MNRHFFITPNRRKHLLRHMLPTELAGSHFYPHVFGDAEVLIDYINVHEPLEVIQQLDNGFAFCFSTLDGNPVGTSGLAKRKVLQPSQIEQQVRDGFTIEVGIVDSLPVTHLFCVIAHETSDGFSIITAFPGGNARPFPRKSQPREEFELNRTFWKEHVLLKSRF
jgi:hypothetical protein